MAIMTTTTLDECSRRYVEMELQSCLADITGDESAFKRAADVAMDALDSVLAHGTDADKAKARAYHAARYWWNA